MARTKIVCPDCGQEISKSNFSKHQRRHQVHPETFKIPEYRVTHAGSNCQFCGKTCKNNNSLSNHERLCKENPNKQVSNLTDYNNHHVKVNGAWNKGLTKETDDRVAKNALSNREHYRIYGSPNKGRHLSEEHKRKISETILKKSYEGEWHTSLARRMHYTYNGQDLHGTWELEYAKWLDTQHIKWVRNKSRFTYMYENTKHYYTPDFYLPDEDAYIEIKGYKTEKDVAKWEQFPHYMTLKVLFYQDLLDLGIEIKN